MTDLSTLTNEDLARIERCLPERDIDGEARFSVGPLGECGEDRFDTDDVLHLVAEVRRLRARVRSWHDLPTSEDGMEPLSRVDQLATSLEIELAALRSGDEAARTEVHVSERIVVALRHVVAELRRLRAERGTEPLADHELDAIEAACVGITERAIGADLDETSLATTIHAAEYASGPEVVGLPVPVARRIVGEILRLRAAYAATIARFENCYRRGGHSDPDNSGLCIYCALVLDEA